MNNPIQRYIFNSKGSYVAFISEDYLFSTTGEWLGYLVAPNSLYGSKDDNLLGYISSDDRIVKKINEAPHIKPLRPLPPSGVIIPQVPSPRLLMTPLPNGWIDYFDRNEG